MLCRWSATLDCMISLTALLRESRLIPTSWISNTRPIIETNPTEFACEVGLCYAFDAPLMQCRAYARSFSTAGAERIDGTETRSLRSICSARPWAAMLCCSTSILHLYVPQEHVTMRFTLPSTTIRNFSFVRPSVGSYSNQGL